MKIRVDWNFRRGILCHRQQSRFRNIRELEMPAETKKKKSGGVRRTVRTGPVSEYTFDARKDPHRRVPQLAPCGDRISPHNDEDHKPHMSEAELRALHPRREVRVFHDSGDVEIRVILGNLPTRSLTRR